MIKKDLGVLIVHMSEPVKKLLTYNQGTVNEGLLKVNKLLDETTKNNVQIFYSPQGNLIKKICENINNFDYKTIGGWFYNLNELMPNIKRLILLGFHGSACVLSAAKFSRSHAISFCTSKDLLFGNSQMTQEPLTSKAEEFYLKKGKLYNNYNELLKQELFLKSR